MIYIDSDFCFWIYIYLFTSLLFMFTMTCFLTYLKNSDGDDDYD